MRDTVLQEDIGQRIRDLRMMFRYSQAKMAGLLEISENHYRNMEAGRRGISIEQFLKLRDIFHVTIDYLITGAVENREAGRLSAILDGVDKSLYPYIEDAVALLIKLGHQINAGEAVNGEE